MRSLLLVAITVYQAGADPMVYTAPDGTTSAHLSGGLSHNVHRHDEACAAGKTSNVAFNYHAAGALTISAAAGDMDGEGDTILKALPSSATIKDVFKADRYTTTQCTEVRVCISRRMTLTD